jgi:hypothetical protein
MLDCTWCNGPTDLADPAHPDESVLGPVLTLTITGDQVALHGGCIKPYQAYLDERNAADPEGSWWLIEEQHGSDYGGLERVEHWFVHARTATEAFLEARHDALQAGKEFWYFGANELEPYVKDYIWAASDGSSVCYEVRKIGSWPFASLATDAKGSYN